MSEPFDSAVEYALIHGIPVEEHLADPLQIALEEYARQIAETGKVFPCVAE